MIKIWVNMIVLLIIILMINTIVLKSQNTDEKTPSNSEEWFYVMNYEVFSLNLICYENNNILYLPIISILSNFKIFITTNEDNSIISGFFLNSDSTYQINIKEKYYKIGANKYELSKDDYLCSELDVYLSAQLLNKMFHFSLQVLKSKLEIKLESKSELPILTEYNRKQRYNDGGSKGKVFGPLIAGRERHWLYGGSLEYQIAAQNYGNKNSVNFNTNTGIEILGGQLQTRISGNYDPSTHVFNYNDLYEWNYRLADNKYFTQFKAGNISNAFSRINSIAGTGIVSSPQILGCQITNETYKTPAFFSNFIYEDNIEPNWTVELYLNNQLYSQTVSDPNGYYKLELPVQYGSSFVTLKFFSPYGEQKEINHGYYIPTEYLAPGEIKYTILGGRQLYGKNYLVDCRTSLGITHWLSSSFIYQRTFETKEEEYYAYLSATLFKGVVLNSIVSPNKYYSSGLRIFDKDNGNYEFAVTKFDDKTIVSDMSCNYRLNFSGGLPFIDLLPFRVSINASREICKSVINNIVTSNLYFNVLGFSFGVNYSLHYNEKKIENDEMNQGLSASLNYSWLKKPSWLSFLDLSSISVYSNYDINYKKFQSISASLSQSIASVCYIQGGVSRDLTTNNMSYNMGLSFNFSGIRSYTSSYVSPSGNIYNQNFQGNIVFDANQKNFDFNSNYRFNNYIETGNANIILYIDKNVNSKYDKNEEIVPNIDLRVEGGSSNMKITDKGTLLQGLVSNTQYNVLVDNRSILNPLLIPAYTEFSFIADPNCTKSINIPCYYTGIVEGRVSKFEEGKDMGQAGVKMHFYNKDNGNEVIIPVFGDGSFYQIGILPGNYSVFIDSLQLKILGVNSVPEILNITINSSSEGDFVGNLNFEVVSKYNKSRIIALETDNNNTQYNKDTHNNNININSQSKTSTINKINQQEKNKIIVKSYILYYKTIRLTTLSYQMKKELDKVAEYLVKNPNSKVVIEGYSDSFSTQEETQKISNKRAAEVQYYLNIQKKINKERIKASGKGRQAVMVDNSSPEGREKNRRVEIKIMD